MVCPNPSIARQCQNRSGVDYPGRQNIFGKWRALDEFDPRYRNFLHHRPVIEVNNGESVTANRISNVYEDSHSRIWAGGVNGLYQYLPGKDSFLLYNCPSTCANPVIDNIITSIFEDHAGQLWISSWGGGLKKFNPEENKFETYKWENTPTIPSAANIAFSVGETRDRSGRFHLWVATPNGMGEFDREKKDWNFYQNEIQNPNTISSTYVTFVYSCNADLLWLGTTGGVNLLDPNKQFFTTHKFAANVYKPEAMAFGQIMCLLAEAGINWVATWYGNGLYKLDNNFNLLQKWRTIPPGLHDPNNFQVSDITRDGDYLWISTFNGLVRFDERKNKFKRYLPDEYSKNDFPSAHIIRLFIDSHGRYWVFFYRKGFSWLNPQIGTFTRAGDKLDGKDVNYDVRDILEDNAGNIWLALADRILIYYYDTRNFRRFDYSGFSVSSSPNCLMKDHTGKIWIGTGSGIAIVDPVNRHWEFISRANGLSNNNVVGMLEDKKHRIWIATHNGLNLYNPKQKVFRLFTENDGLESNDLNLDFQMTFDGRFLLCGSGYITEFSPDSLCYNQTIPPVAITGFKIFGRDTQLPCNAKGEKQITISYKENEFSFDLHTQLYEPVIQSLLLFYARF